MGGGSTPVAAARNPVNPASVGGGAAIKAGLRKVGCLGDAACGEVHDGSGLDYSVEFAVVVLRAARETVGGVHVK